MNRENKRVHGEGCQALREGGHRRSVYPVDGFTQWVRWVIKAVLNRLLGRVKR